MWHMFFCSVLAFCLVRSGYVAAVEGMTMDVYMRAIVPIGLLFSVVLWTGNTAYMYLSVSFIQMLKVRHARGSTTKCWPIEAASLGTNSVRLPRLRV